MATPSGERLGETFFARDPVVVAYDLLGCRLVSERAPERTAGWIVEVEAYAGPADLASHAGKLAAGRAAMFGPPGRAYVYRSYGIHTMLNVVAHEAWDAGAILIRALEPCAGIPAMVERRGRSAPFQLCAGPGRLCQALDLRLTDDGADLGASDELWIEAGPTPPSVLCSERIGISKGRDALWRFFTAGSRYVSMPRRGAPCDRDNLPTML